MYLKSLCTYLPCKSMLEQAGFWFGLSLLLEGSAEEPTGSQPEEERSAALDQAAEHWQACVRSCNDPWVLGRVLGALDRARPTKQQLCWLAATLLERRCGLAEPVLTCFSGEGHRLAPLRPAYIATYIATSNGSAAGQGYHLPRS